MGPKSTELEIPGIQLLERIGEGGTSKVYRAMQLRLQRPVAVKLIEVASGEQPVHALHRESRLMASLDHPNLVTIFDCGQVGNHYYIVTELVNGTNLRPKMSPGHPWPIDKAAAVIDRIARALSYIHAKGILHLDLKPENILGESDGGLKITDFGLALAEVDAQALSDIDCVRGTADYCSPEQRFGLPTSERSDLFSLAVLAYELLTGQLPGRVFKSACQLNPQLPGPVDRVLKRGLARSPEDRYATVEDFRRELNQALRGEPGARRRWFVVGLGLAIALGTAILLAASPRGSNDAPATAPSSVLQAWFVHDRGEQLQWLQGGTNGIVPEPLLVHGRGPVGSGGPPLPVWPSTRPVIVVQSDGALGFIHPLSDPTLGRRLLANWNQLVESPPTQTEDNLCAAGNFSGDCLTFVDSDETRPWRALGWARAKNDDVLALAEPPDRAGNPALLLHRKDANVQSQEFGCYQWLGRIPERPGTVAVMRFRARAELGEARLAVRVQLPLLLPSHAAGETVDRLRGLSQPFPELAARPDEEPRQYKLENWVTPTTQWRSYYTVWEWPPYCHDPAFRNLVVYLVGTGKVWLDDLEVFVWELGGAS
jgi:serine/threonine protein kinase